MPITLKIVLLTSLAGLAMPAGAILATFECIRPRWLENEFRHSVIAFGGGVLLSAVALVLVPDGAKELSTTWVAATFFTGGLAFLLLDVVLERAKGSASQLVAMLADFIPEALALGAAFATGERAGLLLALLITLQNLPEGFNACRELMASSGMSGRRIVVALLCLAPLGPVAGLVGCRWLADMPHIVGGVMLFAAGGILYLTFQDIAPQARLTNRHAPALGAVVGFLFGLVGQLLVSNG